MGLFSRIFNDGKELLKVSNAVANVNQMLDLSEREIFEINDWLVIAWICRIGIIDIIEKNNWPMTYNVVVPIQRCQIRMTLDEAYMMSVGRLSFKTGQLNEEVKDAVLDILDKGDWFYEVDKQMPEEKKMIFK